MNEMTRYLAGRNETSGHESYWQGEKVLAYLNQVILSHHPANQVGIRNQRELTTLAMAIDYMLEGDYVDIQFFRPETKGHLKWSWKLVKAWS